MFVFAKDNECTGDAFSSIPNAMFYIAIFLGGEWGQIDFTWPGKILCCALCVMGIALFAIPVGTVFEAFQDVLQEVHTEEEEEEQEVAPKGRWNLFGIQIGKRSEFTFVDYVVDFMAVCPVQIMHNMIETGVSLYFVSKNSSYCI